MVSLDQKENMSMQTREGLDSRLGGIHLEFCDRLESQGAVNTWNRARRGRLVRVSREPHSSALKALDS